MKVLKSLIDLIYPPRCLICQAFLQDQVASKADQDLPYCPSCFNEFTEIKSPI